MVKYRPSRKVEHGEAKNWCQENADTCPLLYNMNRINVGQPLLITSGELDCAAAIEAGWINAVSIPLGDGNTHWVEQNFDWLEQFSEIIICPDNDESGSKYCREIVPRLGSWKCKIATVPNDCKDINEALYKHGKEVVLDFIAKAKDTPVPSVNDLSDIEDIDLDKIDGIYTGLKDLDKELMKLFYGTLTIVSGVPGSGKTSFLYQLICQSLDQGINTWLFSRELPEWMSRNWFNYIMAGRRHLNEKHVHPGAATGHKREGRGSKAS
jgi:twinkle protein